MIQRQEKVLLLDIRCDQQKDKTSAAYWACNLPRYAKSLGTEWRWKLLLVMKDLEDYYKPFEDFEKSAFTIDVFTRVIKEEC
jgi:hypothetical protein